MLAIVAVVVFAIAYIIQVTGTSTPAAFAPDALVIVGLALLALHLGGLGAGWKYRR